MFFGGGKGSSLKRYILWAGYQIVHRIIGIEFYQRVHGNTHRIKGFAIFIKFVFCVYYIATVAQNSLVKLLEPVDNYEFVYTFGLIFHFIKPVLYLYFIEVN